MVTVGAIEGDFGLLVPSNKAFSIRSALSSNVAAVSLSPSEVEFKRTLQVAIELGAACEGMHSDT